MNAHDMFVDYVNFKCNIYSVPEREKEMFLNLVENYHNDALYNVVFHDEVIYFHNYFRQNEKKITKKL